MRTREGCGTVAFGCLCVLVALAVFAALAGALVLNGQVPLYAPRLTGFAPDPNYPFLPTTPMTLTFDQPMDPASVEAAFSLLPPAPGDFIWNENHTQATFIPGEGGYQLGTSYTVRFAPGAEAGTIPRTTTNPVKWSFSLPPLLDEQPLPLSAADLGPQPLLQAKFNYDLDCEATLQTFSIRPDVAGKLDCGDRAVVFSPTDPLDPDTAYTAELTHVFLAGDDWPQPGVHWEFQTAPPLTVTDVSPAEGESLTDLWTPVRIRFNRPVVADSVVERFSLIAEDGSPIAGQASWQEEEATFVFQPDQSLIPDTGYQLGLQAGVQDELGFELADPLVHGFETEPLLVGFTPIDGAKTVPLDGEVRVHFAWPMDRASVEVGLSFDPALEGEITWEENTLIFAPLGGFAAETRYQAVVSADVRDASGAPLAEPHSWSFQTQPFILDAEPEAELLLMQLQQPVDYTFALPMDRRSVQSALTISPATKTSPEWSNDDRIVSFHPDPAWESGVDYEIILSGSARTADGAQTLGEDHTLTFSTAAAEVQFGEGPNVQVTNAAGERAFQLVFRGADVVDFALYPITPTQFLDLYSSGFRGIGPQESQIIDTAALTPTVTWREAVTPLGGQRYDDWQPAEAHIPAKAPRGLYILTTPGPPVDEEAQANGQLLVVLTDHTLVLKRALAGQGSRTQAQLVAWDTQFSDGAPVVSATVRLYDRDGAFLAEGLTDADGLLVLDAPGDPGPLMALSDSDGDLTVCGLSNEWSQSGWWWWWTAPPSRPLYTTYSYTDRPIYRPAQTIYFKNWLRADDDVSYTLPSADLPVTVRLRDARDNVAASQVLTPTQFGTVHGEFQLADEPMLGDWNLETEVEGAVTRQPLKVEEYRKPKYEVIVQTPQKTYVHGETISLTVDAAYYLGQPVAGADVALNVYPTYPEEYFGPQFGYPVFIDEGRTDAQGQWTVLVSTDDVFYEGQKAQRASVALVLEATVSDDSGQSVSSYQTVVVQRTSQGLTLLLEQRGYGPNEEIVFTAQVRDRDGEPAAGVELTARVLGWDGQKVAGGEATTDGKGEAHFSVRIAEQGGYDIRVIGVDDGGREMAAAEWLWVYDPTGQAPWYQGQWGKEQTLSVSADRTTYDVGDEAQLVVYAPAPGQALLTFERGKTREAQPITLVSGTNLITAPIRADYAPNIYVTVNQFGSLGADWRSEQSQPEGELRTASTQLLVPMDDRLLTVTLTADAETYAPGDEATFQVQVVDQQGQPVVAEVSLAVVDEAIYALAEDLSRDPFEVFYAPRPNVVRTFDSLKPARWLFPEGPGLGGGDGEAEGGAPRRDFLDTAYWAPTVVTDENGEATITFALPDNLTEWRALARAVTTDTLAGQATRHVVVSQDMVVRPVLPRFLIQGDAMTLTAVVHNFTGRAVSATVELELEGIREAGNQESGEQVVHVPAGGSAVVGWPVVAEEPGEAQVTVRATAAFGARLIGQDAVELPLMVQPLAIPEVATFAGTLTPGQPTDTMTITLPADAIEGLSRLEVNLAPSVAPGLLDGIEYLIDYPFG